jgi:hypothetical protein
MNIDEIEKTIGYLKQELCELEFSKKEYEKNVSLFATTSLIVDKAISTLGKWDSSIEEVLGLQSYIDEYRTIKIGLKRQCGKSFKLASMCYHNSDILLLNSGNYNMTNDRLVSRVAAFNKLDAIFMDEVDLRSSYVLSTTPQLSLKINRENFFILKIGTNV